MTLPPSSNSEEKNVREPKEAGRQEGTRHWTEYAAVYAAAGAAIAAAAAASAGFVQNNTAWWADFHQNRAYVVLKGIDFVKRGDADLFDVIPRWENTGNTPTSGMTAYTNSIFVPADLPPYFSWGDIGGGVSYPISLGPKAISAINFLQISSVCVRQYARKDRLNRFYIWGHADYKDVIYGKAHITRFCFDVDEPNVSGDGQSMRPSYHLCPQGNCIDEECQVPADHGTVSVQLDPCK